MRISHKTGGHKTKGGGGKGREGKGREGQGREEIAGIQAGKEKGVGGSGTSS